MTMLRSFWEAAEALDPEGAARFSEGAIMRYAKPDDREQLWLEAGLDEVRVEPLVAEAAYDDFDDLWAPFLTGVGPAGRYAASVGADAQAALRGSSFAASKNRKAHSPCRPARGVPSGASTSRSEHFQAPASDVNCSRREARKVTDRL
jgi:hypothetical protein